MAQVSRTLHMAHLRHHSHDAPITAPPGIPASSYPRKSSAPPSLIDTMPNTRNNSTSSTGSVPSDSSPAHPSSQPQIRSRSIAYGTSVILERDPTPQSDDDIMFVTVRLSNAFRRGSRHGAEDLPSRSFFRRLSTRLNLDHTAEKEERYKAVKMPRGEYNRFFRHDVEGKYAGTEPEREWEEEELMERFREYQNVPLARNFS